MFIIHPKAILVSADIYFSHQGLESMVRLLLNNIDLNVKIRNMGKCINVVVRDSST